MIIQLIDKIKLLFLEKTYRKKRSSNRSNYVTANIADSNKNDPDYSGQCPLCKNHCSLTAPRCMRGKTYIRKNK